MLLCRVFRVVARTLLDGCLLAIVKIALLHEASRNHSFLNVNPWGFCLLCLFNCLAGENQYLWHNVP